MSTNERGLLTHSQKVSWKKIKAALSNREVSFDFKTPEGDYDDCPAAVAHWNIADLDKQITETDEVPYLYDAFPDQEGVLIQKGEMADGFYGYQIMAYDFIDMVTQNDGDMSGTVKAFDEEGEEHSLQVEARNLKQALTMKI